MVTFAHNHDCLTSVAVGLLSGALLLVSNSAAAQGRTSESARAPSAVSRSAQADVLLHQGQALLDSDQLAAACAKFEAAEALEIAPVTLLRLGDCYQRAGRTASAWHSFLEAEAVARAKKDLEQGQLAAQRVSAIEPQLTRVLFVVPTTSRVPGLTVRLGANTVPPSAWDTAIAVDPGVQRVSASAKGYQSWSVELDATHGEGQLFRFNVPTLSPSLADGRAARGNAYRTAGVVTGSVGLAGIGAGALFGALSRNADSTSTCVKGVVQCTPSKSNSMVYTDAATVSFALGGALLATGVTLFVLAPSPDNKEQHALRVAARYASSGGRVQLEGVW